MAYINFKPSDYFATKTYTGNGSAGNAQTGVGFAPNFVWLKSRSNAQKHCLFDTARGVTKTVYSDNDAAEVTEAQLLTAFGSDGFTLGTDSDINGSGWTYASWNWKAGTTSGLSGGTITPTAYSINTTSGFGIYRYNCTGANATIAHGLSSAPKMLITKSLGDTSPWAVWHTGLTDATKYLVLNETAPEATGTNMWNSTAPSSTLISLGADGQTNGTGKNNIMYAFAPVKGYSSFGSYTGSGNANGPFIYTGFRPKFFIAKESNSTDPWHMWTGNASTSGANNVNKSIQPNDVSAEATDNNKDVDFLANGVKLRTSNTEINGDGAPYIYMAWAAEPIVGSNGTAGVAR